MDYIRPERLSLKLHPTLNEKWVQDLIAADPGLLGIGNLELRDKERVQNRAGRLDLLLQDQDTKRRYEVEVQLGRTDESHIIRTIEYWDIERKRYPQYEHCAVLIAEEITGRFLNVISLFNGNIPLIAIQMQAFKFGEAISLIFTKVLDEIQRGLVDDDEAVQSAPANREFWEKKGSRDTVLLADELFAICKSIDATLELKYNTPYISLRKDGSPFNFVYFRPRKNSLYFQVKLPKSDDIDSMISQAGIEQIGYEPRDGYYNLSLSRADVRERQNVLKQLITAAYQYRVG